MLFVGPAHARTVLQNMPNSLTSRLTPLDQDIAQDALLRAGAVHRSLPNAEFATNCFIDPAKPLGGQGVNWCVVRTYHANCLMNAKDKIARIHEVMLHIARTCNRTFDASALASFERVVEFPHAVKTGNSQIGLGKRLDWSFLIVLATASASAFFVVKVVCSKQGVVNRCRRVRCKSLRA